MYSLIQIYLYYTYIYCVYILVSWHNRYSGMVFVVIPGPLPAALPAAPPHSSAVLRRLQLLVSQGLEQAQPLLFHTPSVVRY